MHCLQDGLVASVLLVLPYHLLVVTCCSFTKMFQTSTLKQPSIMVMRKVSKTLRCLQQEAMALISILNFNDFVMKFRYLNIISFSFILLAATSCKKDLAETNINPNTAQTAQP